MRQEIENLIEQLIGLLDLEDGDTDLEDDILESNLANDRFGDERESDPAEWGIGDKDGLIEQNCTIYEVAA